MTPTDVVKRVLPPPVYNGIKKLLGLPVWEQVEAGQKDSEFYDRTFDADDYWRAHYTKVPDYACWTVILDRLRAAQVRRTLEIGCGSGHLASAIRDAGVLASYCGFDFSERRVSHARTICPEFRFEIADAFATDLYRTFDYDSAVSTEFLEHVEGDLTVLAKLKPGTKFIGMVPNMPWVSHVRYFKDCAEVTARYSPLFDDFSVVPIPLNEKGYINFVMQGIRNRRDDVVA
jgi:SAM-dependent methyltransferase